MINQIPVKSGIGWGDDLSVKLQESKRNRWFPQIHSGWYYINNQEQYLFASEGILSTTVSSGLYTSYDLIDLDIINITKYGPLIIDSGNYRYNRVTSNLSVFNSYTPTASGLNLLYIDVPGEVVLVTDNQDSDLSEVSKISFLSESSLYYYNRTINRIWISRDPADTNRLTPLLITYLKVDPGMLQEEIILVDSDGLIRTMFGDINYSSNYLPVLVSPISGSISVSGVVGNTITPSGTLTKNTRLGVKYYQDRSFCVVNSTTSGKVLFTFSPIQEDIGIRYEQGFENRYLDTGSFPVSGSKYIQINPLLSGVTPGFLSITPEESNVEYLKKIKLYTSINRVSSKQRQTVDILVRAISTENDLLSRIPINCWITNSSGDIFYPKSVEQVSNTGQVTDFKGDIRFSWNPNLVVGLYTVYASTLSISGTALLSQKNLIVEDVSILTDISNSPKVLLYLSPNKDINGLQNLYMQMVSQTGIPYLNNLGIQIYCENGNIYPLQTSVTSGNTYSSQTLDIYFDGSNQNIGIKTLVCRYEYINPDKIYAKPIDNKTDSNPVNWSTSTFQFESIPLEIHE